MTVPTLMLLKDAGITNHISMWNREKMIWQFLPMTRFQRIHENLTLRHFFGASITQETNRG